MSDDAWWAAHWKENTRYLVMRLEQVLAGEKDVLPLIEKVLPHFKEELKQR